MPALITSRTREHATVTIDHSLCNRCGYCIDVCKGKPLYMEDNMVKVDNSLLFGCIGCGHCVAVCPKDCITVEGRTLSTGDFAPSPEKADLPGEKELLHLMLHRRSIRLFKEKEVEREKIEKIITMASTAPMGLPPSDVGLLVLDSPEKVREFARDVATHFRKIRYFFSPPMLFFMNLFLKKEDREMMSIFIRPLLKFIPDRMDKGEDWLLYNAPAAIYFHATPYTDPADPYIAATYAMLGAESMGLGTCMIGSIAPMIKSGAKGLKSKYGIPPRSQHGIVLLIGYPKYKFRKSIRRSFARVDYH